MVQNGLKYISEWKLFDFETVNVSSESLSRIGVSKCHFFQKKLGVENENIDKLYECLFHKIKIECVEQKLWWIYSVILTFILLWQNWSMTMTKLVKDYDKNDY